MFKRANLGHASYFGRVLLGSGSWKTLFFSLDEPPMTANVPALVRSKSNANHENIKTNINMFCSALKTLHILGHEIIHRFHNTLENTKM